MKKLLLALCLILVPALIFLVANGCSKGATQPNYGPPTSTFTITPTPTNSPVPTSTPTNTPTRTFTGTPTNTSTPCNIGGTPCTSTDTPTVTSTFTATSTPTNTPTPQGWTFSGSLQGWSMGSYSVPSGLAAQCTVVYDNSAGYSGAGSAKITIPFTGPNQQAIFSLNPPTINMGSKTTANVAVSLVSGLNTPGNPGTAKIYIKTGACYIYADGGQYQNMNSSAPPAWSVLSLNIQSPSYASSPTTCVASSGITLSYDPTQVDEVGLEVDTNSSSGGTTAVIYIDDWLYQ